MTLGNDNGTDGQTDRQTDGQTECDAICGPLLGRRAAFIKSAQRDANTARCLCRQGSVLHSLYQI